MLATHKQGRARRRKIISVDALPAEKTSSTRQGYQKRVPGLTRNGTPMTRQLIQDLLRVGIPDCDRSISPSDRDPSASIVKRPSASGEGGLEAGGVAVVGAVDSVGGDGEGLDVPRNEGGVEGGGEEVLAVWGEGEGGDGVGVA
jgi:hypothetical protein